jgi:hypothetical protein
MSIRLTARERRRYLTPKPISPFEPLRPCSEPACDALIDRSLRDYCGRCRKQRGLEASIPTKE